MPERRLAAVTGASAGIGAMFSRKLAARGYDLLLVARRQDRLESLARELSETCRVQATALAADLAVESDLLRVERTLRESPNLALLVNGAGFGTLGFFGEADVESQERMHRLHVIAPLRLTHAALANQVPRNAGGVINVSSVSAFLASPGSVSYSATKAWMNRFTEALSTELAQRGSQVKVQALCPGFTLSEFHDTLGMDRSAIPNSLWMTAEFVVQQSLAGFDRGELFVIPGWRYKLLVTALKLMPGAWMRRAASRNAARYRRPKG